ncbi:serine O-acetyltransferase [Pedobacter sp. WC2501]|uniref:serine O-acetyltransferase n=1 Tax=Pedobacter sp. WC2501 TaxID=3461400 RepID=UPI0040459B2B
MIKNRKDYQYYLKQDAIALGVADWGAKRKILDFFVPHYTYKFQRKLRKLEYYKNCKQGFLNKCIYFYMRYKFREYSLKLGLSIPENVFGPGLAIVHTGTIVVNPNARVGMNCRIQACTNIGASGGQPEAPVIGDNVYIGPGAKIYGNITIASNCAIAANAAVGKSFYNENMMIGGIPAKEIKQVKISDIIKHIN